MDIRSIEFSQYKVFGSAEQDARWQRLQIAPLTYIFGKNNSGKSAVARLPLLMLGGIACDDGGILPLDVANQNFGSNFLDIASGGDFFSKPSFRISIAHGDERLEFEIVLYATGAMAADEPPEVWSYRMDSPSHVRVLPPGERHAEPPRFSGLLPKGEQWDRWRLQAKKAIAELVHLGPVRDEIALTYSNEPFPGIGVRGAEVPQLLRIDTVIADMVGAWYFRHMDGWRLSLQRDSASFSLRIAKSARHSINLSLAGEGLQQVLAVVAHQYWRQGRPGANFLDIVEQPELHLHPAAQAPLTDLFIETALATNGRTIVETNSEGMLLRLQRRVAEGVIDPSSLRIYFVSPREDGSDLCEVQIQKNGDLDWWPDGVFEEDFQEVAAIRRAQRARVISGDRL